MKTNRVKTLFLIIMLAAIFCGSASAATFTVNSITDAVDANPGDGICSTAGGVCTLRAAIQEANALAGQDTIILPEGTYNLTIEGSGEDSSATGDLDITDAAEVIIQGAGAATTIIDGNGIDRVFHIQPDGVADISGVTIQGGITPAVIYENYGGGILNSGGVLTITGCTISGNISVYDDINSDGGYGGGIYNDGGYVAITDSTISDNTTVSSDGYFGYGGGIYNDNGVVTITDCTVSGNIVTGSFGVFGGIENTGTMIIQNSTIKDNTAAFYAGIDNQGDMTMTNCTIFNNISTDTYFGGACGGAVNSSNVIAVQNSTIVENTPSNVSNGDHCWSDSGVFTIRNSIVANTAPNVNCVFFKSSFDRSSRNNLSTDSTCRAHFTQKTAAQINLGVLTNNGGPTDTMALLTGSAAIDSGDDASCPATDQRGILRPQGAHCDIGAFELGQGAAQVITITTNAPQNAVYNTGFTVAATGGGSGNPVAYSSEGACTNVGDTFTMTSGTGTCTVKYNQAGNGEYSAAPQVTETVTAWKADQTITVTQHAPLSAAFNTDFTVSATGGGSGNGVVITASGACSGSGTGTALITMTVLADTCTVFFNQAGDANYNQAPQASETTAQYILTVTTLGSGSGSVSGNGIACSWNETPSSDSCSSGFSYNDGFNLTASPGACSYLKEWGTACSGTGSQCSGTMTGPTAVAAMFELYPLTRLSSPTDGYSTIAEAYTHSADETIQIQAYTFSEDLVFNREGIDVVVEAGWNCDYTQLDGVVSVKRLTVQYGSMTLTKGGIAFVP